MPIIEPSELKAVIKRQEAELKYAVYTCAVGFRIDEPGENSKELRLKIMEIGAIAHKVARDCEEALSGF